MTGGFTATLESADRSVSVTFDSLTLGAGYLQSSQYTGEVASIEGFLQLTPLQSEALLGAGSAIIALTNEGPDVTVGLAPFVLRHDLYASLSGGPLSVGALPGSVNLESQENGITLQSFRGPGDLGLGFVAQSVPEPGSAGLLLGGGALLCGLSLLLRSVSRRRK